MLEQVSVQELKYEALVLPEVDMLDQAHYVVLITWVLVHEESKQLALLLGKLVVNLRVSVDFHRNFDPVQVVDSRDDLSEAAFTEDFEHLETVEDLVTLLEDVVAIFVIFVGVSRLGDLSRDDITSVVHSVIRE